MTTRVASVPHRSRSSKPIRRHLFAVPEDERTVREGIPVTTVPRTVLDLAATGYTVTRITWNQLDDEPLEIASDLRALLKLNRRGSGPTKPPEPSPQGPHA